MPKWPFSLRRHAGPENPEDIEPPLMPVTTEAITLAPHHPDWHLLERQKRERRDTLYKTSLALSGAKIRVFIVEPAQGFNIRGELQVVDLDDPNRIQYDALSYCWGDPSQTSPIICPHNNVQLRATPNCISAISHIYRLHRRRHRHDHLPSTPLAIWIDAICINQEDKDELSQQLPLMGRIYANARETYFWLGEGDPATDKVIEYLARGCLPSPKSSPWMNGLGLLWAFLSWYWTRMDAGLTDVLSRDWVNRVWTLQECILSPKGTVVCGDAECPWFQIVLSVQFYDASSAGFMPKFPPDSLHIWASLSKSWLDTAEPNKEDGTLQGVKRELGLHQEIAEHLSRTEAAWRAYRHMRLVALSLSGVIWLAFALTLVRREHSINIAVSVVLSVVYAIVFAWVWLGLDLTRVLTHSSKWRPVLLQESLRHELKRRDCQDPRDKYRGFSALLGGHLGYQGTGARENDLVANLDQEDGATRTSILGRVYTHLSVELLLKMDNLDMLLIDDYYGSGCPSWVTDWRSRRPSAASPLRAIDWSPSSNYGSPNPHFADPGARTLLWLNFRYYHARTGYKRFHGPTRDSKHQWDEAEKTKLRDRRIVDGVDRADLVVRGRIISEITFLRSRPEVFNHYVQESSEFRVYESLKTFHDAVQGLDPSQVAICLKYLLLIGVHEKKIDNEDDATFRGFDTWCGLVLQADGDVDEIWRRLKKKRRAFLIQFWLATLVHSSDTSLARCSGGEYMGFGITTPRAEQGDLVVLISGLSLPMVVRANANGDGKFRVVGPAFFGGLMDGRVWDRSVENGLEDIVLC